MASLRQLLVISSIVIACILIGMLVMGLSLMGRSLDAQLQTDSENAVSTLALLVSAARGDSTSTTQALDAVFQQGRYQSLSLEGPSGQILYEGRRLRPQGVGDTSSWFDSMIAIEPHVAQRVVPQLGTVRLVMDAQAARDALGSHAQQWMLLALGIALFWALFIASLLSRFRREWATGMGALPDAPEVKVKDTTHAESAELLDEVVERVPPTVDEQMARIERLEIELNRDPVTGMANRAYFLNEIKRLLRDDGGMGAVSGYVLLIRQRDMAEMLNQTARADLDSWLRLLGERIADVLSEYTSLGPLTARLSGNDFVVLFPVGGGPQVTRPVQRLRQMLETLKVPLDSHRMSRWALAMTDYTASDTPKELLTRLDVALMYAESAGHADVEFLSHADHDEPIPKVGEASWRTLLNQALHRDQLSLTVTVVAYEGDDLPERNEGELVLHEAPGQQPLSGFLFMPAATRLGLSAACDVRAVALGLTWLGNHPGMLILRMSLSSLLDEHFVDDVMQVCDGVDPKILERLTLEFDAHGLSACAEQLKTFTRRLTSLGVRIGLRRLDEQTDALQHIHEADFSYVKLGGNFVRNMLSSPGGVQIMVAVTETAIGMGMKVYVDDVADERTRQMVQEYGALPRRSS
ncbi:EAL domain-containing protein [Alcaligenaceae bacterium CGII-47]|nr:EAL domain-containing protein [Alcaligenaceae bacterium CGII-47]